MIERHYNMVGRPPDMRSLEQESISSLAVLEQQSAGRRSSRVNKKTLRKVRQAIKNAHARSGKQIAARALNRPSYSRPEKEGLRSTRVSIVDRGGQYALSKGGARTTTHQQRTNQKNTKERATQSKRAQSNTRNQRAASKGGAPKPSRSRQPVLIARMKQQDGLRMRQKQRVPGHDLAGGIDRASSKGAKSTERYQWSPKGCARYGISTGHRGPPER